MTESDCLSTRSWEPRPVTVADVLHDLKALASEETRLGMKRYGIPNDNALGVAMRGMKGYAKRRGRDHALAGELWQTGIYEAQTVAAFIADPGEISSQDMDRWARDFDNWAICDTVCYHLFDQTPHAWDKVRTWAPNKREFVRRAAHALIWALSVHDRESSDQPFVVALEIIENMPADDRPLVKKSVDMALRAVGKSNRVLNRKAIATARGLAASDARSTSWIGRHALKELESDKVQSRLR